jgi:hypothetical protein
MKTGDPTITKWDINKNIKITQKLSDYIDGLLLSDGHLSKRIGIKRINTRLSVKQCKRRKKWLYKIQSYLLKCNVQSNIYFDKPRTAIDPKNPNKKIIGTGNFCLETKNYPTFNEIHERWYHNKKKIVPINLKLSPIMVANWYLGDGSFFPEKRHARVKLCTCAFSKKEILFLIKQIKKTIKITHIRMTEDDYCIIILSQNDVMRFINYIPQQFKIPPFRYKFKWSK